MKKKIFKGSINQYLTVFIQDSSSITGAGLGSLDETSSIVGGYVREGGTGVALAVDENVTTEGTYEAPSAAGKVRIGTPANMRTGTYELHFHNDLFAAGADSVFITLGGATDMADLPIEIQLDGPEAFLPAYMGPRGPGVYYNDAAGNTNTVDGTDGTVGNPVSTIAAVKTIADSLSLDRIYLVNDSSVTLTATMEDYEFIGIGEMTANSVNYGSQDVDNSVFYNLLLTGAQGGTGRCQAVGCALSSITGMEITALGCLIADGGSLTLRNDCAFDACFSAVAGSGTPTLDINSVANVNVYFRHYSGGMQIDNAVATTVMSYESDGQLVIDATCTGLTIVARGNLSVTDNGTSTSLNSDAAINLTNIGALIGPNVHGADCWYVDSDRADDTGDGLRWSTAKKTIGAAFSASSSGDTLIIGKGSYVETSTITIAAGESLRMIGSGDGITSLDNDTALRTIDVLGVLEIRGMFIDNANDIAINLNHANARLRMYDCRFYCGDVGVHVNVSGAVAMFYRCYADSLYDTIIVDAGGRVLFADGIMLGDQEGFLSAGETLATGSLFDCNGTELQHMGGNLYASGCGYGSTSGTVKGDDVYYADVYLTVDETNTQDEYTVQWYKNGAPVTSGITVPKIQVVARADGADLVANTAMTEIGSTGAYKYDESTNRLTSGESAVAYVTATIDGSGRTWRRVVGRDIIA